MSAPFAALEQRVNAAVHSRLANASAVFAGVAEPVEGIFDREFQDALGVEGSLPVFRCLEAAIAGVTRDTAVTIRGVAYTVIGIELDRTGAALVKLQLAVE